MILRQEKRAGDSLTGAFRISGLACVYRPEAVARQVMVMVTVLPDGKVGMATPLAKAAAV